MCRMVRRGRQLERFDDFGGKPKHPPGAFANPGRLIVDEVISAMEAGQLEMPMLPDIAIKTQQALNNQNISAENLVHILSIDPVVAVHVIRAANSSAFHASGKVDNLRDAVSRLGYRLLYSIVMNITLTNLFRAKHLVVDRALRKLWRHSREVAANCYVLAEQKKNLRPEVALLAGLVHEIGALPLYQYADRLNTPLDQGMLDLLVDSCAIDVTPKLLEAWEFPDLLVGIVAGLHDPGRITGPGIADYVDILTMADLQTQECSDHSQWRNAIAAERLGYYPGDCENFFETHEEEIAMAKNMLGIGIAMPQKPVHAPEPQIIAQLPQAGFLDRLAHLFNR